MNTTVKFRGCEVFLKRKIRLDLHKLFKVA